MSSGRSIRLFLVDGTPNGLLTAEIVNWTGHVLTAPRSKLKELVAREECSRTGIYFLVGNDPEDPYRPLVYIGESDDVARRLAQHDRLEEKGGKDFWERVCLVTSKDQNLTKSHIKYLESELIRLAAEAGACALQNGNRAQYDILPESDVSDMQFFIEQIRTILPVLGFNFLQSARRPTTSHQQQACASETNEPLFTLSIPRHDITASAKEADGELVVLAGSQVRNSWTSQSKNSYEKLYHSLVSAGIIGTDEQGNRFFTEDYAFNSPSAAAAIISGRSANGRIAWIENTTQLTYGEWQSAQLEQLLESKELKEQEHEHD